MRVIRLTTSALGLTAMTATCALAAAPGPSPGVDLGSYGIRGGPVRYYTLPASGRTNVQAISVNGGQIIRYRTIRGAFGIPLVANDGSTGGLSRDGRTLVLASVRSGPNYSRFALLDTHSFKVRDTIRLEGTWSYDALSPDAHTLYLIQHVFQRNANANRYYVRAYDLAQGRLLKKIIFDTREKWGLMSGTPITRATTRTGRWVYTLYTRPGGKPFVHALDAANRKAVCIDLPWRGSQDRIWGMRLRLSPGRLVVHQGSTRAAVIDTRTFRVSA
jgi:hypothetical protein